MRVSIAILLYRPILQVCEMLTNVSCSGRRRGVDRAPFSVLMGMLCVFIVACTLARPASEYSMRMLCEETKKACVASAPPSFLNWSDLHVPNSFVAYVYIFCRPCINRTIKGTFVRSAEWHSLHVFGALSKIQLLLLLRSARRWRKEASRDRQYLIGMRRSKGRKGSENLPQKAPPFPSLTNSRNRTSNPSMHSLNTLDLIEGIQTDGGCCTLVSTTLAPRLSLAGLPKASRIQKIRWEPS